MSDLIQLRGGTTSGATAADDTLLLREIGITDDRTAGVGDCRGWLGDGSSDFAAFVAAEPRGLWATPGDLASDIVSLVTGQSSSVDSEVALFSGTGGKTIKRATLSGVPKLASGVLSGTAATINDLGTQSGDYDANAKEFKNAKDPTTTQSLATKAYVDLAVTGLFHYKGATNCSTNPNYPAALKGDTYMVSVAGKIGGASGVSVDVGDLFVALADNAGGTQVSVGASWDVLEHNLIGALTVASIGSTVQAYGANLDTWATKTAPSGTAVGTTDAQTLTAKRVVPRVETVTSSSTPAFSTDSYDLHIVSALATNITSMTSSLTGTPNDGEPHLWRFRDFAGVPHTIAWGASFVADAGVTLPGSTLTSKTLLVRSYYDSVATKHVVFAVGGGY